jgi:hypothetical protein
LITQNKFKNSVNTQLQYLNLLIVFGLILYISSNLQTNYRYPDLIYLVVLTLANFILVAVYIYSISFSLRSLTIFKYVLRVLSIQYICYILNILRSSNLNVVQSSTLLLSLILIMQAISANFDPLLYSKYRIKLLDIILALATIIIANSILRSNPCPFIYFLLTSVILITSITLFTLGKRILAYLVLLIFIFFSPPNVNVLLVRVLTTIAIITYIEGFVDNIVSNASRSLPSYTNANLISIIILIFISIIMSQLIEGTTIMYLIYILTITLIIIINKLVN